MLSPSCGMLEGAPHVPKACQNVTSSLDSGKAQEFHEIIF